MLVVKFKIDCWILYNDDILKYNLAILLTFLKTTSYTNFIVIRLRFRRFVRTKYKYINAILLKVGVKIILRITVI